jgi:hypothetical protein
MTFTQSERLASAVNKTDWLRRPPSRIGEAPRPFKEWLHFCIYGGDLDLLINLSEVDDPRRDRSRPSIVRQTLLARTDRWLGGIEEIQAPRLVAGDIEADFDGGRLRFEDGRYRLRARGRRTPIDVDLELEPLAHPAPIHNVTVGDGPPIHWVVIPRLRASGWARVGDREFHLDGVPAYHDHNWGDFGWGRDFAWEWGFGLPPEPENPWSLVFARLSNRALTRTRMQTLFIWRDRHAVAAFRDDQIEIRHRGLLRPSRVCRVPPVMALVARGGATDIPAEVTIRARASNAELNATFVPGDVAQVIIPNDDDLGTTIINEVAGELQADIRVGEDRGRIACRTIFEFLGR